MKLKEFTDRESFEKVLNEISIKMTGDKFINLHQLSFAKTAILLEAKEIITHQEHDLIRMIMNM